MPSTERNCAALWSPAPSARSSRLTTSCSTSRSRRWSSRRCSSRDRTRLVGTLQAFGIYAVGFVARPVGAALFGHYGDRIGRKATLIATLLLTGLSTFAVGFVPGYAMIGIWGAVILTVLRFIQGMGIGGEWGGATLIAMEWAKTNEHRGFITSWPQWGGPVGCSSRTWRYWQSAGSRAISSSTWGWRVPFWLSIVMVVIGIYIRLGIMETPVFRRMLDEEQSGACTGPRGDSTPAREIVLTALCTDGRTRPVLCLCRLHLHLWHDDAAQSRNLLLTALMIATGLSAVTIPLAGHISDRIGRKRMYLIGAVAMGLYSLRLLRPAEHGDPGGHLHRHHPVVHSARHDVRAAGGADR